MFVAGLTAAPVSAKARSTDASGPRNPSTEESEDGVAAKEVEPVIHESVEVLDEFEQLKKDCRSAFEPHGGKADVWAEKEGKERRFRILLVERVSYFFLLLAFRD